MTAERLKGCRAGRRGAWRSGLICLLSTGSAPPPPCFSSVHHGDHSFFFSFSIFRYPRVPRKKGQTVPKSYLQNAGAATRSTKGPSSARPCSWGKRVPVGTWTAQEAGGGWGRRNAALALSPEAFDLPETVLGGVPGWAGSCDQGLGG